jgi:hypothetical protein
MAQDNTHSIRFDDELEASVLAYANAHDLTVSEAIRTLVQKGLDASALGAAEGAVARAIHESMSVYLSEIISWLNDIDTQKLDLITPALTESQALSYATLARVDELSARLGLVDDADSALAIDALSGYDLMSGTDIKGARASAARQLKSEGAL